MMVGASASRWSLSLPFSTVRSSATSVSCTGPGSSTTRCSTRPVSVINTSISRTGLSSTVSMCRTRDRDSDGYCTTATLRVSWASARTAFCTTPSRSTASLRNFSMARRSAEDSGLIEVSLSTNTR